MVRDGLAEKSYSLNCCGALVKPKNLPRGVVLAPYWLKWHTIYTLQPRHLPVPETTIQAFHITVNSSLPLADPAWGIWGKCPPPPSPYLLPISLHNSGARQLLNLVRLNSISLNKKLGNYYCNLLWLTHLKQTSNQLQRNHSLSSCTRRL